MILELVKDQFRLTSVLGPLLILSAGVVWLWRRPTSRGPRYYLTAVVLAYWILCTPLGATLLVSGLGRGLTRVMSRDEARGAEAVLVLGGGARTVSVGGEVAGMLTVSSITRALEGARVFKLIGARLLIASGGIPRPDRQLLPESQLLRDALVRAGVPPSAIIEESKSRTTREEALLIGALLRDLHVQRFVLVTSPPHMGRSLAVFRAEGLDPIPSVSPVRSDLSRPVPWLLPNDESRSLSDEAVYGYAAWVYYWARGWTRPH